MTFWGIGGIYIQFNMEEETYLAIYYDDSNQKIKTSINEVKDWLDAYSDGYPFSISGDIRSVPS